MVAIEPAEFVAQLRQLWWEEQYNDVSVVLDDGKQVMAHKVIIAANSTYCHGLLQGKVSRKKGRPRKYAECNVSHVSGLAVEKYVLPFLYGYEIDLNADNVAELLKAADKLGIEKLKKHCMEFIGIDIKGNEIAILSGKIQDAESLELAKNDEDVKILGDISMVSSNKGFEESNSTLKKKHGITEVSVKVEPSLSSQSKNVEAHKSDQDEDHMDTNMEPMEDDMSASEDEHDNDGNVTEDSNVTIDYKQESVGKNNSKSTGHTCIADTGAQKNHKEDKTSLGADSGMREGEDSSSDEDDRDDVTIPNVSNTQTNMNNCKPNKNANTVRRLFCELCSVEVTDVTYHRAAAHGMGAQFCQPQKCISPGCDQSFTFKYFYTCHMSSEHKRAANLCPIDKCDMVFKKKKEYIHHSETAHQTEENKKTCPQCGHVSYGPWRSYITHMLQAHNLVTCEHCNWKRAVSNVTSKTISQNMQQYREHMLNKHSIVDETVILRCAVDGCQMRTYRMTLLQEHAITQHVTSDVAGVPTHSCKQCDFTTKSHKTLRNHIIVKHGAKMPCKTCGKQMSKYHLKLHELECGVPKEMKMGFMCDVCNLSMTTKFQLQDHQFTQHGIISDKVKPFVCEQCGYGTLRKHRLEKHIKTHSPAAKKEFPCETCGKLFSDESNLKLHQKLHSGTKFACPHCEFTGSAKRYVLKHIRLKHMICDSKPFKCGYCDYRCNVRCNCIKHVRLHHAGLPDRVIVVEEVPKIPSARDSTLQMTF